MLKLTFVYALVHEQSYKHKLISEAGGLRAHTPDPEATDVYHTFRAYLSLTHDTVIEISLMD